MRQPPTAHTPTEAIDWMTVTPHVLPTKYSIKERTLIPLSDNEHKPPKLCMGTIPDDFPEGNHQIIHLKAGVHCVSALSILSSWKALTDSGPSQTNKTQDKQNPGLGLDTEDKGQPWHFFIR